MRFYSRQHRHYCGIDLHVKTMCVCILDASGQVLVHQRQIDLDTLANVSDEPLRAGGRFAPSAPSRA